MSGPSRAVFPFRKGKWRVERHEGERAGVEAAEMRHERCGEWVSYYNYPMPMRAAMQTAKRLKEQYKHRVFRCRHIKSGDIIMADIL